jgi:hypothetical protein
MTETPAETKHTGLARLRDPFPPEQINKLPKPTISNDEWKKLPKATCKECGGYHATSKTVHLDFVGHAALTARLLEADEAWTWDFLSLGPDGYPVIDKDGGMWIKLTVCGVTRLGYGDAQGKTGGNAMKERIGDALRNAAMRFGAALDLWHKGEAPLFADGEAIDSPMIPIEKIVDPTKDALRDQAANEYAAELCAQIDLCTTMEKLVEWRKANSDKVNGLAPVHKAKVTAYWMEIEKIIKES